jgi:(p)ppGpp synthase/HD superfamily hydrolase
MSTLHRAIEIATKAHEGATDKYGAPYINPEVPGSNLVLAT